MSKTNFTNGKVVTTGYLNSIYVTDGGHKHDGKDDDGHCEKIGADEISESLKTNLRDEAQKGMFPIGSIMMYGGSVAPENYLLCDGSSLDGDKKYDGFRNWVDKNSLNYLKVGGVYRTPNLCGKVPLGADTFGDSYKLGNTGGEAKHTLTADELPKHDHTNPEIGECKYDRLTMFSVNIPNGGAKRTPGNLDNVDPSDGEYQVSVANGNSSTGTSGTIKEHRDAAKIREIGNNEPHNNMQPYFVINYIIRAIA
jgi:microcystin-dependent protein